ncbi:MAG: serine/threonine-protein phosphatase [Magnetococcales bacterium]|nr:serine/threonine-protein phosphatase [Magnetococcales bacterium]NGZ25769.1 serine/threonine-protein phosphatase [Magnetococcales bacterium]
MIYQIGNRLKVAGHSDVGCVRTLNEDNFKIDEELGLLIVADGMGGHDAGEVASAQVIEVIQDFLRNQSPSPPGREESESTLTLNLSAYDDDEPTLDDGLDATMDDLPNPMLAMVTASIHHANSKVNAVNRRKGYPDGMGMGATVVGMWLPEYSEDPVVFHVGDSRLYMCRKGKLLQLTQDHSMYQQWVNFGGTGTPPAQNILLQAMGPSSKVTPDVRFQHLDKGDLVMICSDGLTGMVPDAMIEQTLRKTNANNLNETCQQLIELAKQRGGKDNITVIVGLMV